MIFSVLAHILSLVIDLCTGGRRSEQAKDLEILVLRQQLCILQRTQTQSLRPSRWENLTVAVLTARLRDVAKTARHPWRRSLLLFTPPHPAPAADLRRPTRGVTMWAIRGGC
jgi:hypothetical protein